MVLTEALGVEEFRHCVKVYATGVDAGSTVRGVPGR